MIVIEVDDVNNNDDGVKKRTMSQSFNHLRRPVLKVDGGNGKALFTVSLRLHVWRSEINIDHGEYYALYSLMYSFKKILIVVISDKITFAKL